MEYKSIIDVVVDLTIIIVVSLTILSGVVIAVKFFS